MKRYLLVLISIVLITGFCFFNLQSSKAGEPFPFSLVAKNASEEKTYAVELNWSYPNNTQAIKQYQIMRKVGTDSYQEITVLEKERAVFVDKQVFPNKEYIYNVIGYFEEGIGKVSSNQVTIIIPLLEPTSEVSLFQEWLDSFGLYNIFAGFLIMLLVLYLLASIKHRRKN